MIVATWYINFFHSLSDCCRVIIVEYSGNSTQVFDEYPDTFQEYEMQPESLNDRPYYIGTTNDRVAIAFDNCGSWDIQATSARSVVVIVIELLSCSQKDVEIT